MTESKDPKPEASAPAMPEVVFCFCGKSTNEPCPTAQENCECGGSLELEYGFCHYGLGVFSRCQECCAVYNFQEDQG